jgi:hypothetical protein
MPEGDDRVPAMGGRVRGAQERLIADRYLLLRQLAKAGWAGSGSPLTSYSAVW